MIKVRRQGSTVVKCWLGQLEPDLALLVDITDVVWITCSGRISNTIVDCEEAARSSGQSMARFGSYGLPASSVCGRISGHGVPGGYDCELLPCSS